LGSGKILKLAIKQYGKENFKKTILEVCHTEEELNIREKYWIEQLNCREDPLSYNIGEGGHGGDNITFNPNKDEFIKKMKILNSSENNGMLGKKHSTHTKQLQKDKSVGRYTLNWFIERYGSDIGYDKYLKRNEKLSNDRRGENNPEYRHVPEIELFNEIMNTTVSIKYIAKKFNVGNTCIYGKLKKYWNCKTVDEVREKYKNNNEF
jgi:group I intron endonuclease